MNHWRRKFWIIKDLRKLVGCYCTKRDIWFVFQPLNDEIKVVKLLKQALLYWSDRTNKLTSFRKPAFGLVNLDAAGCSGLPRLLQLIWMTI